MARTRAAAKASSPAQPKAPAANDTNVFLIPEEFRKYMAAALWMPPSVVEPWVNNPRVITKAIDKVAASIARFGFVAPICIWTSRRRMVAGHTRLAAYGKLVAADPSFVPRGAPGPGLVPVRFHEFKDENDADAYALADNKLGEIATWDDNGVAAVLARLRDDRPLFDATGFNYDTWFSEKSGGEDDDEDVVPEPPKVAKTKLGDVYILGEHRLLCGDCRKPGDVAKLLDGAKINVAVTSPPYASQRKYDASSGFKPIHPDAFLPWFDAVQANVKKHLTPDGSFFLNIKEHAEDGGRHLYVLDLVIAHVRQWGWTRVDDFCWVRPSPPGRWPNRFKNGFEPVFHFAQGEAIKFRPQAVAHASDSVPVKSSAAGANVKGPNGEYWNLSSTTKKGLALPSNVIQVAGVEKATGHTAAFPVALPEFFIKAYSDAGDCVFDPFMGSGTTIVACEKTQRRGFGIELSPMYCDQIVERWERRTKQKARLAR